MSENNNVVEKYKIWDVLKKQWFRPTYPGMRPDNKGKIVNHITTEEILFSMSGEMYMRRHNGIDSKQSASVIDCEEFVHVSTDLFIPCLFTGLKDSNALKIYEGHIIKVFPENGPDYFIQIKYDKDATSWNPYLENGEYTYSIGSIKNDVGFTIEIAGHILETPDFNFKKDEDEE